MKMRRALAALLSVLMLATMVSVGFVTVSAETVTWSDGVVGKYAPVSDASDIMQQTSLVLGQVPRKGTNQAFWSDRNNNETLSKLSSLSDGSVGDSNSPTRTIVQGSAGNWSFFTFTLNDLYEVDGFVVASSACDEYAYSMRWIKIYVGNNQTTLYDESNLVVDIEKLNDGNKALQLQPSSVKTGRYVGFGVYCPDVNLSQSEAPLNYTDNGNRICTTDWWSQIRLSELGVYGTAANRYTATGLNAGNAEVLEALNQRQNILVGSTFNQYNSSTKTISASGVSANPGQDRDGKIYGVNTTEVNFTLYSSEQKTQWQSDEYAYNGSSDGSQKTPSFDTFVYDLGSSRALDTVLIAFNQGEDIFARSLWAGQIYVGDDPSTLISAENLVGSWDLRNGSNVVNGTSFSSLSDVYGYIYSLTQEKTGRYVACVLPEQIYGNIRVPEIGVFGNHSTTTILKGSTYDVAGKLGQNLMTGVVDAYLYGVSKSGVFSYFNASGAKTDAAPAGVSTMFRRSITNPMYMTDGRIPAVYNSTGVEGADQKGQISIPDSATTEQCTAGTVSVYYIVFALDKLYSYNSLMVGLTKDSILNSLWFGETYSSETLSDLFAADSRAGSWNSEHTYNGDAYCQAYVFSSETAVRARYVGLVVPAQLYSQIRIGEIGLFGKEAQTSVVRLQTPSTMSGEAKLSTGYYENLVASGDNLLNGLTPYKYGTGLNTAIAMQFGYGMADERILNYNYTTDDIYDWKNNTTGYSSNSNFTGFTNPGYYTMDAVRQNTVPVAKVAFHLDRETNISHIVVGQSSDVPTSSNFYYKTWYAKVYVSQNASDLYNDANLVAEYSYLHEDGSLANNGYLSDIGLVFQTNRKTVGNYVGFAFPTNAGGMVRFSEVGVYGSDANERCTQSYLHSTADASSVTKAGTNLVDQNTAILNLADDGTTTNTYIANRVNLTDGAVSGVTSSDILSQSMLYSYREYVDFTNTADAAMATYVIDLGKVTCLGKILIGYAHDADVRYRQWCGTVYVSSSLADICSHANKISAWNYANADGTLPSSISDCGVVMDFTKSVEARYVAIRVPLNFNTASGGVRFEEVGVYPYVTRSLGAQIRNSSNNLAVDGTAAIRFGTTLECSGVTMDENHVADYSAATVIVGGKDYAVAEVGTLVCRGCKFTAVDHTAEEALTCETIASYGVKVLAEKMFEINNSNVTFTAVVNNVPSRKYAEALFSRGYVKYIVSGTSDADYVYGYKYSDIVSRNVYDVWSGAAAEDTGLVCGDRADYLAASTTGGYFRKNSKVVFLGDSITYATGFINGTYKYYAASHFDDAVEMYEVGIQGATAATGLAYLEADTLSYNPDYVFVMFGMNDIGRSGYTDGYDSASDATKKLIDTYQSNMTGIITGLQARGVKVILCTPSPFDETTTVASANTNYPGCAEALRQCAARVHTLATTYGCDLVDFSELMTAATDFVQNPSSSVTVNGTTYTGSTAYSIVNNSDRVHPGNIGHDYMARILLSKIGESVAVPANETLLSYVVGAASPDTTFAHDGIAISSTLATAVSSSLGKTNLFRKSWFVESYFIGIEHFTEWNTETKVASMSARYASMSDSDWTKSYIGYYLENYNKTGSGQAAVLSSVRAVYN